jgi:hypothetical protein
VEGSTGEGGTGGGFATEDTEGTEKRKGRERGEKERERRICTRKDTDGRERCGAYISLVQRLESMDDIAAVNRIDRSDAPA